MKTETLEKPSQTKDKTGFITTEYEESGKINIYIVEKAAMTYRTNELNLTESQYVGYTNEKVEVGDRISGKYKVDYIKPFRSYFAVSLSSLG